MKRSTIITIIIVLVIIVGGVIIFSAGQEQPGQTPGQTTLPPAGQAPGSLSQPPEPPQPPEVPTANETLIAFLQTPSQVQAGEEFDISWRVQTPQAQTISHTAVHWGVTSQPGSLGLADGPPASGYPNLTQEFAAGTFNVPDNFAAKITAPDEPGTMYLRTHAIVGGDNYWSDELSLPVTQETTAAPPPTDQPVSQPAPEPPPAPQDKQVSMRAGNLFFSPAGLEVEKGQKVTVTIQNTGFHTFTISELDINERLPSSGAYTVEFTPQTSGTFEYFCAVPGHKEGGMFGSLQVN